MPRSNAAARQDGDDDDPHVLGEPGRGRTGGDVHGDGERAVPWSHHPDWRRHLLRRRHLLGTADPEPRRPWPRSRRAPCHLACTRSPPSTPGTRPPVRARLPPLTETIAKADTTTAVVASANPTIFGQAVTFTATVNSVAPGTKTPTGSVTFFVDANPVGSASLNATGQATFTTSALAGREPRDHRGVRRRRERERECLVPAAADRSCRRPARPRSRPLRARRPSDARSP